VLCDSGYSGPVVINSPDTDSYVMATAIFTECSRLTQYKEKNRRPSYDNLGPEEMVDYKYHYTASLPTQGSNNSKLSGYHNLAKNAKAQDKCLKVEIPLML